MNWLIMDYFSSTFSVVLTEYLKPEKFNFLRIVSLYMKSDFTSVFIGYENGWKESLHLKIAGKRDLSIAPTHKCEIKI